MTKVSLARSTMIHLMLSKAHVGHNVIYDDEINRFIQRARDLAEARDVVFTTDFNMANPEPYRQAVRDLFNNLYADIKLQMDLKESHGTKH